MSSVRPAVPGAAPPLSDGVSVVLPPAVVLCSKAQQVNSAELTRKKHHHTWNYRQESTLKKPPEHVFSTCCQVRQAPRSKLSSLPRKYSVSIKFSMAKRSAVCQQSFILFLKAAAGNCFYSPSNLSSCPAHTQPWFLLTHVTVAPHVAEDNIPSQHHGETPKAPLPHIDVFVVVSVVTCGGGKFSEQPDELCEKEAAWIHRTSGNCFLWNIWRSQKQVWEEATCVLVEQGDLKLTALSLKKKKTKREKTPFFIFS